MKTYTSLEIELIRINPQDVITASAAYCGCHYLCGAYGHERVANGQFSPFSCNCTDAVHNPNPTHKPVS